MQIRTIICAAILLTQLAAMGQSKKVTAETNIQNVTIFASGARVERSANLTLSQGRTEISFPSLSNQLDQQSVQIKADANITLLSVQATKDFVGVRKIEQEEKDFLVRMQAIQSKLEFDKKLFEVYKREEEMLTKNEAIGGNAGVKTTELKEALDLHRQRLTEVYQKQLEIQDRIESEQKEFDTFNKQSQEISKKKDSINYIITALVESRESRNVHFQLLYNIKDAGWYTTYDVRVKDASEPLKALMNANVFQRSGETWKNISISLSTGNPTDNATSPQLQPWMLGYYDPNASSGNYQSNIITTGRITNEQGEPIIGATVVVKNSASGTVTDGNGFFKIQNEYNSFLIISSVGYQQKEVRAKPGYNTIALQQGSNALQEVVVTAYGTLKGKVSGVNINSTSKLKQDNETIQTVNVATEYQPTTTVYQIKDKYTLETDGKTTTIGIKEFDIPSLYDYHSVPKIDPSAFLTAKIINWQDFDLQSGEASLYFEGTYLGKTYIDLNAVSDTLSLSLGKDNGIKISRKLIKEFSSKRFIGSNRTDSKTYEISVRNTKNIPVVITVNDQFPLSINKEISVDDLKAPEAQVDKETGLIAWTITLQPGQEKKLTKSYSVKYPKDKKVVLE
jgi:hypothetical protein